MISATLLHLSRDVWLVADQSEALRSLRHTHYGSCALQLLFKAAMFQIHITSYTDGRRLNVSDRDLRSWNPPKTQIKFNSFFNNNLLVTEFNFSHQGSEWRGWERLTVAMKTRLVSNGKQSSSSNLLPYPLLQFLDLILECLSSLRLKILQFKLELFDLTFGWLASSLWIAEAILALTEFLLHTGRLDKKKAD